MCIVGCSPKQRFRDYLCKKSPPFDELIEDKTYLFEEILFPRETINNEVIDVFNKAGKLIKFVNDFDTVKKVDKRLGKEYEKYYNLIRDTTSLLVKNRNIFKNEWIYQSTLVYCKGKTTNIPALSSVISAICSTVYLPNHARIPYPCRPSEIINLEEGDTNDFQIKIIQVFSSNQILKGYLYNFGNKDIYVLGPYLTKRYLTCNKSLKNKDFIEGMNTVLIEQVEDINDDFKKNLNILITNKKGVCIFIKDEKIVDSCLTYLCNKFPEEWKWNVSYNDEVE